MLTCWRAGVLMCICALVLACLAPSTFALEHRTGAREHPSTAALVATGMIAGSAIDATTGQAMAGVAVTLRAMGRIEAEIDAQVLTDSLGRFIFPALGAGVYDLSAAASGFGQAFARVELGPTDRATDVSMRLPRHGSIAGTVRDDAGDPVAGAPVSAFLTTTVMGRSMLFKKGGAIADDRGRFRIPDLASGEYVICVCTDHQLQLDAHLLTRLGPRAPSVALVAQTLGDRAFRVAPSFHPHGPAPSGATRIRLGTADDRSGIDIAVNLVSPVRVSGRLRGVSTIAAVDMTVLLVPEGDLEALGATHLSPASVTPEGTFEFTAVPPGRYSLEAFPQDLHRGAWASVPLTIGHQDVSGLAVLLQAGATVSGQLQFEGAAVRPTATALEQSRVALAPVDSTPRLLLSSGSAIVIGHWSDIAADGTFRIENLPPGRYALVVTGLSSWRTDNPLLTVSDNDLAGVLITMTDTPLAAVQGTVVLDKYDSPQQSQALLFPADASMWAEPMRAPSRFALETVSATRTFKATGIPAGDYFIVLVPTNASPTTPEGLEAWSRRATRITLRAGETKTITLRR